MVGPHIPSQGRGTISGRWGNTEVVVVMVVCEGGGYQEVHRMAGLHGVGAAEPKCPAKTLRNQILQQHHLAETEKRKFCLMAVKP